MQTSMKNLRERMAEFGFESNEDYEYQVRCLLNGPFADIRALNIQGDAGRRKTAFACALARALGYPHVIYHDYSERNPPPPDIIFPPSEDESGKEEPPIDIIDCRLSDACAQSEAEDTIVILDQLQDADFREHIRIYNFLTSGEWTFRGASQYANHKHMMVFLISEKPIYHSLQKHSFRIWVHSFSNRAVDYRPRDFGLDESASPMMEELGEVFQALKMSPTRSEYEKLLHDIYLNVRTPEGLRHSIFGWTEGVDRHMLFSVALDDQVKSATEAILDYLEQREMELTASISL